MLSIMLGLVATAAAAMVTPLPSMQSISLPLAKTGEAVSLDEAVAAPGTSLVIFGTYPADFNMIEYAQRVKHYLPALRDNGVDRILCVVNGKPASCNLLTDILDLPADIELLADEAGEAGRAFGVSRGWMPDTDAIELGETKVPVSPYAKLFGMLLGAGAGNTCVHRRSKPRDRRD